MLWFPKTNPASIVREFFALAMTKHSIFYTAIPLNKHFIRKAKHVRKEVSEARLQMMHVIRNDRIVEKMQDGSGKQMHSIEYVDGKYIVLFRF